MTARDAFREIRTGKENLVKALIALVAASVLAAASPAVAAPKVYSGLEAKALKCSELMIFLVVAGDASGEITRNQANALTGYAGYILDNYTSGSHRQKARALEIMMERTSVHQKVLDLESQHLSCLRLFPLP